MTVLYDKNKKPVAYIYNNAILQAGCLLVTGLILGDCVYGLKGMAKGKYLQHVLYNKEGEIVATTSNGSLPDQIDTTIVLYQTWQLLGKIREYDFPRIRPLTKWSSQSLQALLH